jgi:hypothetical protein
MANIEQLIELGWECYKNKVANGLLLPKNEKMMQLQIALIYQTIAPIFEFEQNETIKVLLEVPVIIHSNVSRSIDIVIDHTNRQETSKYPIELKCFRLMSQSGKGKSGGQLQRMYDYWEDIENIEQYSQLQNFKKGFQFTVTDDPYYVETQHTGIKVVVFSTYKGRSNVTGQLSAEVQSRAGNIQLSRVYDMAKWIKINNFYFVDQTT